MSSVETTDGPVGGTTDGPVGGGSNQIAIILVVVCVVLGLLLLGVTVVILCFKRGRSNQVAKEDAGM